MNADTITLYCCHEPTGVYHRALIIGVLWDDETRSTRLKTGQSDAAAVFVIVPDYAKCDKAWALPREFDDSPFGRYTWRANGRDMIVLGDAGRDISPDMPLGALIERYGARTITSVDYKGHGSARARHWEIGGR